MQAIASRAREEMAEAKAFYEDLDAERLEDGERSLSLLFALLLVLVAFAA